MTADSYVVVAVHTDAITGWMAHTAYYGPYPGLGAAADDADRLHDKYAKEPMRVDGRKCTTTVIASTLLAPPRWTP